jgi:hypothetical protein
MNFQERVDQPPGLHPGWGAFGSAAWKAAVSAAKNNGMPGNQEDFNGAQAAVNVMGTCYNAYPLAALSPNYGGIFPSTVPLGGWENW